MDDGSIERSSGFVAELERGGGGGGGQGREGSVEKKILRALKRGARRMKTTLFPTKELRMLGAV